MADGPIPINPTTIPGLYSALIGLINGNQSGTATNITNAQNNINLSIGNSSTAIKTSIATAQGTLSQQAINNQIATQKAISTVSGNIQGSIASNSAAILLNIAGSKADINNNANAQAASTRTFIGQTGANIVDRISSVVTSAQFASGVIINSIAGGIQDRLNQIGSQITGITSGIGSAIDDAIGGIGDFLSNIWANIFNAVDQIGMKLNNFWSRLAHVSQEEIGGQINKLAAIVEKVKNGKYTSWQALENDLEALKVNTSLITGILSLLQIVPIMLQISQATTKPFTDHIEQLANEQSRGNLLDANSLIAGKIRGTTTVQHVNDELGKLGYTATDIQLLLDTAFKLPDENIVRILLLRGIVDDKTHDSYLRKLGYQETDITHLKMLYRVVPPLNDLIRFAVREVYSPDIAQKFGQFEDFPDRFAVEAAKQGLDKEQAKNYWAAHWELPSPNQGFEMFHRGIINRDDLETLMRALDVMPYWRDKLIQMNYNPVTRVDIRRMYKMGIYARDDVYNHYLTIGYSPKDATDLTEFTVRYEAAEDASSIDQIHDLTRGVIITAYTRKQLTRAVAKQRIIDLKYAPEDAELLLDIADYNEYVKNNPDRTKEQNEKLASVTLSAYQRKTLSHDDALANLLTSGYVKDDAIRALGFADLEYTVAFKAEIISRVKELYLANTYTNNEVLDILTRLDFTQTEIQAFIDELMLLKIVNTKKPTLAQFTSALKQGFIQVEDYTSELLGLGFSDKYVPLMLQLAGVPEVLQ